MVAAAVTPPSWRSPLTRSGDFRRKKRRERFALSAGAVLLQEQVAEALLEPIDPLQNRMGGEIGSQFGVLLGSQVVAMAAHQRQQTAISGRGRIHLPSGRLPSVRPLVPGCVPPANKVAGAGTSKSCQGREVVDAFTSGRKFGGGCRRAQARESAQQGATGSKRRFLFCGGQGRPSNAGNVKVRHAGAFAACLMNLEARLQSKVKRFDESNQSR
jgi:hypothetical protein